MAYRVFTLPVHDPGAAETELNGFLASHRVLSVDRRFVEEGERSFWTSIRKLQSETAASVRAIHRSPGPSPLSWSSRSPCGQAGRNPNAP